MAHSQNVREVSDQNFDAEVLKSTQPVIVDFWAEWCGPCKMLAPTIDAIAEKFSGKLKVCKVNVDENQKYAAQYRVRSIPAVLFFKNGQLVDQLVGAQPEEVFVDAISRMI